MCWNQGTGLVLCGYSVHIWLVQRNRDWDGNLFLECSGWGKAALFLCLVLLSFLASPVGLFAVVAVICKGS